MDLVGPSVFGLGSFGLVDGLGLVTRRKLTVPAHNEQAVFVFEAKGSHPALSFLHGSGVGVRRRSDVSPSHCDGAQTVQCIVMASAVTTSAAKVVDVLSYAGTRIEGHPERRYATGRELTPFPSAKVEDVHNGCQLDLFGASVRLWKRLLPSSPQEDLLVDHGGTVANACRRLVSLRCKWRGDETEFFKRTCEIVTVILNKTDAD